VADTTLTVRSLIQGQPDRAFSADVRGPPVLVSQETLDATGLITPTSLVDYEYRVRLEGDGIDPDKGVFGDTGAFIDDWRGAFPTHTAELNTVEDRNDRVSERLNEVAAVLLLIAVATLLGGVVGCSAYQWCGGFIGKRYCVCVIAKPCRWFAGVNQSIVVTLAHAGIDGVWYFGSACVCLTKFSQKFIHSACKATAR